MLFSGLVAQLPSKIVGEPCKSFEVHSSTTHHTLAVQCNVCRTVPNPLRRAQTKSVHDVSVTATDPAFPSVRLKAAT